jgi:hypothetical protein
MKRIFDEEGYHLALRDTYLAMIQNSSGCDLFRKLYVRTPDGLKEVIGDGDLACAYFVSSILTLFVLVDCVHTTVDATVADMVASGWIEIDKDHPEAIQPGMVLVWESKLCEDGLHHLHIGFAISVMVGLSNVLEVGRPGLHLITFGDKNRAIARIFSHPKLTTVE